MLKFNTLLEEAGFNPKKVYLLRHQDTERLPRGKFFSTWLSERKKFEAYQQLQSWKNRFPTGSVLASFVVGSFGETLFVGLYKVLHLSKKNSALNDPLIGLLPPKTRAWHKTKHLKSMQEYEGRLVIDWGVRKERIWRQRAYKQNKSVLEIRGAIKEEQFPGFLNFYRTVSDLKTIPHNWQARMKDVRGIYLLTFPDGQLYIGSASGKEGFWQRWSDYIRNGHGGNRVLINEKRDARYSTVSILEFTGSAFSRDEVVFREFLWKKKLGSKAKLLDPD